MKNLIGCVAGSCAGVEGVVSCRMRNAMIGDAARDGGVFDDGWKATTYRCCCREKDVRWALQSQVKDQSRAFRLRCALGVRSCLRLAPATSTFTISFHNISAPHQQHKLRLRTDSVCQKEDCKYTAEWRLTRKHTGRPLVYYDRRTASTWNF